MRLFWILLLTLPATVLAETMYVTDNLRLGIHQAADTSDRAFRMLDSGQPLEVLYRDGNYASVQLPDGMQGFVKAAYLVSEKPAKLLLAETLAERDALQAELDATREALAEPVAAIAKLESRNDGLQTDLEAARLRIAGLEDEAASLADLQQRYRGSLPLSWVAVALGVVLVCGVLLGMGWVDYRMRKRHGGIRIY